LEKQLTAISRSENDPVGLLASYACIMEKCLFLEFIKKSAQWVCKISACLYNKVVSFA